jgi:chromosomal replication initiator protein
MSRILDDLGRRFHRALHAALGQARYDLWIRHARPAGFDEESFTFHVASTQARDRLERLLGQAVVEVARRVTNRNIRLRLDVEPASFPCFLSGAPEAGRQGPPSFAGFVAGPGNRLALSAARRFASAGPDAPRFLLVCARSGLGRTRLLRAIHHALGGVDNPSILLTGGEEFRRRLEEEERRGRREGFLRRCGGVSAFLLDDLHLLSGHESAGLALADLLGRFRERRSRVALTSERHPRDLDRLPRALRGRLRADVEASIDRPDTATGLGVLRRAAPPGTPAGVLEAVARDVVSNHADQLACLARILERPPVTPAGARSVIAEFLSEWSFGLTLEDIVREAARFFGVRATEIYSLNRRGRAAEARKACFYLARKLLGRPFAQIGNHFGGRDHTTVLEACRKLSRARGDLKERLKRLETRLRA